MNERIYLLVILFLNFAAYQAYSQNILPVFLEGAWKVENREVYEFWEIEEDGNMKGYSYRMNNGEKEITEYLQINQQGEDVVYTATVINQNEGEGIHFTLNRTDSLTFSFENPEHDFPKTVLYQKRSDLEVHVHVSDGVERGFEYIMKKM